MVMTPTTTKRGLPRQLHSVQHFYYTNKQKKKRKSEIEHTQMSSWRKQTKRVCRLFFGRVDEKESKKETEDWFFPSWLGWFSGRGEVY